MVAHFEMFRDMWYYSEASVQIESMVCWSSEVLSAGVLKCCGQSHIQSYTQKGYCLYSC